MLASTIALGVDVANNNTIVTQDLSHRESVINRSTYVFDDTHSLANRDQVQFYRTYPKRSGASRGSAKSAIKITTDISVPNVAGDGDIVMPLIAEVAFSVPVGATPAQTKELRQRLLALLDLETVSAAVVDDLNI